MTLGEAWHQKSGRPQGLTERTAARRGEAASEAMSDEAEPARHDQTDRGAEDLLLQSLARERPQADDIRRPPPAGDEQSGKATFAHEDLAASLRVPPGLADSKAPPASHAGLGIRTELPLCAACA